MAPAREVTGVKMVDQCKAYVRGDNYYCDRCGYVWDLNDKDVPTCVPTVTYSTAKNAINDMRKILEKVME